jgi:membrane-associated protease RseP (regulator of RpoE activity)
MSEAASSAPPERRRPRGRIALVLFVLTCLSVFWVGAVNAGAADGHNAWSLWQGYPFALPFLAILVCHELGHYVAARLHGIDASPPYFLPMPLPPIGTLGAVIGMSDPIRRRNALFDVGAAGPVCGLVIALPVLAYGLYTSPVLPLDPAITYEVEGRSLVYWAILYALKGPIPAGHDVMLNATAFAGWAGLLVTMMNLVPAGQLDGGHIAYALFGARQDVYSRRVQQGLFVFGGCMIAYGAWEARHAAHALPNMLAGANWLLWAALLTGLSRAFGSAHPPTDDDALSGGRRVMAWLCLLLFVLLFMPRWLVPSV